MDQRTTLADDMSADLDGFLGVKPPSRIARLWRWLALGLGLALLLWLGVRLFGGGDAAPRYATAAVERGDLMVTVSATGNLQPTNQVEVGSELSGLITHVLVDNNDPVRKGQLLARLDTARLQDAINRSEAALASARASVLEAQATTAQADANLRRLEEVSRLSRGRVPSASELDTARADAARAQAAVATARAAVSQAQAQLSSDRTQFAKASILSPVTGVVLSRQVDPGQTVAASFNAPVLFQIAEDLSRMKLEAKVDEADVGGVREGQRATFQVDAFPGRIFPAVIQRVDVGANATGTGSSSGASSSASASASAGASGVVAYTAVLRIANQDLMLRPGMTATADIVTTEKRGVLLVPNAALRFSPDRAAANQQQGGVTSILVPRPSRRPRAGRTVTIGRGSRQTLYVVGEDGQPKPLEVVIGDSNGSQTEVRGAELKPGLPVITGQLAAGSGDAGETGRGPAGRPAGGAGR